MNSVATRNRILWTASLLVIAALLVALPIMLRPGHSFTGTDDRAVEVISQMGTGVQPWFHPLWEPGSDAVESLLFGLQAAVGLALLVVCFWGLRRRQQS